MKCDLNVSLTESLSLSSRLSGTPHSNSSSSLQSGGSVAGVALGTSKEGMHQRSFSVSSAEQWSEAVINTTAGQRSNSETPTLKLFFTSFLIIIFLKS